MKITKRARLFHLLGLLALVLASGVLFAGCDASTLTIGGGLILGGIIGNTLDHVVIGIIIGGIVGLVIFCIFSSGVGGSSSSSSSVSSASQALNRAESRRNGPHTCDNCGEYSHTHGKCKRSDNPKSAEDTCSDWR